MAQFEYWMTTDLKRGSSQVQVLHGQTFSQDNLGNRVGVVVLDGGEPATLSGTVTGYVIRADGGTVVVVGALDGNKAYIDLPESAYAVPGQIQIAIRLTSGETKTVLGALNAYVQRTATGTIIDPGHVVPDIDDIIAKMDEMDEAIANAEAATTAANTAAQNANNATGYIAPTEATGTASAAHAQGSYLIYDGKLYQVTADIAIGDTLATTGTGANIAQVTGGAMGEVADLKSAIDQTAADENITWLSHAHNGFYLKSDNTEGTNGMLSHTDYIRIPTNATHVMLGNKTSGVRSSTSYTISPNVLFYDGNKTFITPAVNVSGQEIATVEIPSGAVYLRANQPSIVAINADRLIRFVYKDIDSSIQSAIDEAVELIEADVTANSEKIDILQDAYASDDLSFLVTVEGKFVDGTGEHDNSMLSHTDYISVPDWATQVIATSKAYNSSGTNSYKVAPTVVWYDGNKNFIETGNVWVITDTQNFPIPDNAKYCIVNQPKFQTQNKRFIQFTSSPIIAYVGAEFDKTMLSDTSFTGMLLRLKNISKPKTIYVYGGTYDIFAEYQALGLTGRVPVNHTQTADYMPYNVFVPPNTHVIGLGNVTLSWMPTTSQTYISESKIISPLNVVSSAIIENLRIVCKNGRYCIHDDGLGLAEYVGAIKKYINVRCYKYANDTDFGLNGCIGFGIDARMVFEFDNCEFEHELPAAAAFYMHNRATYDSGAHQVGIENSAKVTIKNSVIEGQAKTGIAFSIGNVATTELQDIKVNIDNCYIRGWIRVADEGDTQYGNRPNSFDITLLNCTKTQILVRYENNVYPVRVLNPIGDVLD